MSKKSKEPILAVTVKREGHLSYRAYAVRIYPDGKVTEEALHPAADLPQIALETAKQFLAKGM